MRVNWTPLILVLAAVAAVAPLAIFAQGQNAKKSWAPPRTVDGQPDITGIWSNASIIPLERPKELEGKQFFSKDEIAAYEAKVFARSSRDKQPAAGAVGTYNNFWWDGDSKRAPNLRTSLIVDPPDGKVPPLTPAAQKRVEEDRVHAREHPADGPEDRTLLERCIHYPSGRTADASELL